MGHACNGDTNCNNSFQSNTPDTRVVYTGPPIPALSVCTGDYLSEVESVLLQKILNYATGVGISLPDIDLTTCELFTNELTCCETCTDLPCLMQAYLTGLCTLYTDLTELQEQVNELLNGPYDTSCLTLGSNPTLTQIIQELITEFCALVSTVNALSAKVNTFTSGIGTTIGNFLNTAITSCQGPQVLNKTGSGASINFNLKGFVPIGGVIPYGGSIAGKTDSTGLGLSGTDMCGWALCVTGDTEVTLSDGNKLPISMIVDNKMEVDVISLDVNTGKIVSSRVVNWFKNEVTDKKIWYKIHINHGFSGRKVLTLTHNHPVWTEKRGWVTAENLLPGDKLYYNAKQLTEIGKQALIGMFLSDGTVYKNKFTIAQSTKNRAFTEFISAKYGYDYYTSLQTNGFGKGNSSDRIGISLKKLCPDFINNIDKKEKINEYILSNLTPVSLAFMVMGDGSLNSDSRVKNKAERILIHTQGFKKPLLDLLVEHLNSMGLSCKLYKRGNQTEETDYTYESSKHDSEYGWFLYFTKKGTEELGKLIAPYIHPHYNYKLPERFRNIPFVLEDELFIQEGFTPYEVECKNFYDYSDYTIKQESRLLRYKYRYDVEVENTHSFIANGYIVHNCNGNNGTVDMREQFVVGVGSGAMGGTGSGPSNIGTPSNYGLNTLIGSPTVLLTASQSGSAPHSHAITDPGHYHLLRYGQFDRVQTTTGSGHVFGDSTTSDYTGYPPGGITASRPSIVAFIDKQTTGITISNSGGVSATSAHENRPPARALYYIQRIS